MAGKAFTGNIRLTKWFLGNTKITKAFAGNTLVYSSGYIVHYHVGPNDVRDIEVEDGANCIDFAPSVSVSGWTLHGWRADTTASSVVLQNYTADRDDIHLYAVLKQTITVSLVGGSSTIQNSGIRYYNNGNVANPQITLGASALSGWSLTGYRIDKVASGTVSYRANTAYSFGSNTTLYAVFQQTVTVTIIGGSSNITNTGNKYYNNGNTNNASIKLGTATLSGWSLVGYRNDKTATSITNYAAGSTYGFSSNTTIYAVFSKTITLSYNGNGASGGSTASQTGTQLYNNGNYNNPRFTLSANGYSRGGYSFTKWAMATTSGPQYFPGASVTLSGSTTFYAMWIRDAQTINLTDLYGGWVAIDLGVREEGDHPNVNSSGGSAGTIPSPYYVDCTDYAYATFYSKLNVDTQWNSTVGLVVCNCDICIAGHTVYTGKAETDNWSGRPTEVIDGDWAERTIDISSVSGSQYIYGHTSQGGYGGGIEGNIQLQYITLHN